MTILDTIADYARKRVSDDCSRVPLEEMKARACERHGSGERFYDAVAKPGMRLICEVKKASPSKGVIDPVFPYTQIAADYEAAGADCISCLTEPKWFLGSDGIFRDIRQTVSLPMLRKLLICAILDTATLGQYLRICAELGLAALVEAHDEAEIASAVSAGARMIGVNNRNLKDFTVDLTNAARLRSCIPPQCLYVCESGVRTPQDAAVMRAVGADAILVGEALMRARDKAAALTALREAAI